MPELGLRDPARPRRVGRRRRAVGHHRMDERAHVRAAAEGPGERILLTRALHRHRRLDRDPAAGRRRRLARPADRPQPGPARAIEHVSWARGRDDRRRLPGRVRRRHARRSLRPRRWSGPRGTLGLPIRVGVHTGEVEFVGERRPRPGRPRRGAGHVARRRRTRSSSRRRRAISSRAPALVLEDAGHHELKGLPGVRAVSRVIGTGG